MGPLAAGAAIVSGITSIVGGFASASAAKEAGAAQQTELNYQAAQGQQQAGQALAAGQSQAIVTQDKAKLLQSNAIAAAGGNGEDPASGSVQTDVARIGQRGDYDAATQLYNSQEKAAGLTEGANIATYQGAQDVTAADAMASGDVMKGFGSAVGTIGGSQGVTSMYNKYAAGFLPSWMQP